jgi:hemolysin activation/secretion protein
VARTFGVNPLATRLDTRLRLEGAATDRSDMPSVTGYGRYVADGTLSFPLGPVRPSLTGAAGFSSGDLPIQRAFFVGGLHTVRGQIAKLDSPGRAGDTFWLSRTELGLTRSLAFKPTLFYDIGWAGARNDFTNVGRPLSGAGLGLSFMDGLFRVDVARGIWPEERWRADLYLGSPF